MARHSATLRLAAGGLLLMAATTAWTQVFPARSIRLIVPFPPGGSTDIFGRLMGQKYTEAWGQTVLVDNRPGAAGMIGTELGAKAAPDGYTILLGSGGPLTINPSLFAKVPYDPLKDFTMITGISTVPNVLAVHPSVPVRSVKELVALARARPGALNFASTGNGTPGHLGVEMFKMMTKTDMTHVPYKGAASATTALLGGEVSMTLTTTPAMLPHARAGKVRVIAVSTAQRIPGLPDTPTIAESGLPGYEVVSWYGLVGPAGIPAEIASKMSAESLRIVTNREVEERIRATGAEPAPWTPAEMLKLIRDEIPKWAKIIKASGAKPD
jgi:tripartite-type tricarboxylate transporter receptor subunit TctC